MYQFKIAIGYLCSSRTHSYKFLYEKFLKFFCTNVSSEKPETEADATEDICFKLGTAPIGTGEPGVSFRVVVSSDDSTVYSRLCGMSTPAAEDDDATGGVGWGNGIILLETSSHRGLFAQLLHNHMRPV